MTMVPTRRGQALVMGVGALLIMAATVMISFNIGNAVHERIRLQSASDSLAFSLGVLEARTMNSVAHLNRAIASVIAAEMSLHVYAAIVEHLAEQLDRSAHAFRVIASMEYDRSFDPAGAVACWAPIHCVHCSTANEIADKYEAEAKRVRSAGGQANGKWTDAVAGLQAMTDQLSADQNALVRWTMRELDGSAGANSLFAKLKEHNAPHATNDMNLAAKASRSAFACAFEGNGPDGQAYGAGCRYLFHPDKQKPIPAKYKDRDAVMANVVYGARPNLAKGYGTMAGRPPHLADPQYTNGPNANVIRNPERMMEIQETGLWLYVPDRDKTRAFLDEASSAIVGTGQVGAELFGQLTIQWGHPDQIVGGWEGAVGPTRVSSQRGGPSGYYGTSCADRHACFVNFNLTTEKGLAYNQPSVYGGMRQPLKLMGRANTQRPWELNESGEVTMKVGGSSWNLVMAPQGDAYAVSKAKVYFHQLGDWSVPPNSFDPFWRAKLHPFAKKELEKAFESMGLPEEAALARKDNIPTEGSSHAE